MLTLHRHNTNEQFGSNPTVQICGLYFSKSIWNSDLCGSFENKMLV
jgi:hypothetical protein